MFCPSLSFWPFYVIIINPHKPIMTFYCQPDSTSVNLLKDGTVGWAYNIHDDFIVRPNFSAPNIGNKY